MDTLGLLKSLLIPNGGVKKDGNRYLLLGIVLLAMLLAEHAKC